ncbi:Hypothetical predicted protein [Mytilus galloprovincialis]|uniref:Uncharacterized protein n=1 Tax=Mytilus galloprovincialis TaxID=29158 RepID=A0A8B6F7Y7_MYTGA|nr:Hypothetical predicted protein [Mytilus galloprovincialis]
MELWSFNKEGYVREVVIVQVMSENCNCIIHLVDFNEPPTVANMFNRACSWTCTNETCGGSTVLPDEMLEVDDVVVVVIALTPVPIVAPGPVVVVVGNDVETAVDMVDVTV